MSRTRRESPTTREGNKKPPCNRRKQEEEQTVGTRFLAIAAAAGSCRNLLKGPCTQVNIAEMDLLTLSSSSRSAVLQAPETYGEGEIDLSNWGLEARISSRQKCQRYLLFLNWVLSSSQRCQNCQSWDIIQLDKRVWSPQRIPWHTRSPTLSSYRSHSQVYPWCVWCSLLNRAKAHNCGSWPQIRCGFLRQQ